MTVDAGPVSRIVITFAGPGEAAMTVEHENVQAAQLYGAAWLLDRIAAESRQDARIAAAIQAQAAAELAAGLRNGGRG